MKTDQAFCRSALQDAPVASLVVSDSGIIVYANPRATALIGAPEAELLGRPLATLFADDATTQNLHDHFSRAPQVAHLGAVATFQSTLGGTIPLEITLTPVAWSERSYAIVWLTDPNTSRNDSRNIKARAMQKQSEHIRLLNTILDHSPVAKLLIDDSGTIRYVNKAATQLFGYSADELRGYSVDRLVPQQARPSHPSRRQQYRDATQPRRIGAEHNLTALRKSGEEFPVEIALNPLQTVDGRMVLTTVLDMSERQRAERTTRAIAEEVPTPIVMVDAQGRLSYMNASACELFEVEPDKVSDADIDELVPGLTERMHARNASSLTDKPPGSVEDIELWAIRRDGDRIPIEVNACNIEFPHGSYHLVALTNLAPLLENERLLQRARRLVEEAALAKTSFLATVSHEMRTPLNSVIGMTDMLQDTPLDEHQAEFVRTISRGSRSLLTLIDDLLDLSKSQAGVLILTPGIVDVRDLIDSALGMVRDRALEKGLVLKCDCDAQVPQAIVGDGPRIRQVLVNLLSNAVKFTETGAVTLQVEYATGSPGVLTCVILDTGIGIAEENLPKLFQAFSQLDPRIQTRYGGAGLGLLISRRIAEAMSGDIRVDSHVGHGSSFRFQFPADVVDERRPDVGRPADAPSAIPPLRILLAEDNAVNQRVAQLMLSRLGQTCVHTVSDGHQAVAACLAGNYDVVLMDVSMPEMDGIQACRAIRTQVPSDQQPWIVAMTANVMPEDRQRCHVAGMDDFLGKPMTLSALSTTLQRVSQSTVPET